MTEYVYGDVLFVIDFSMDFICLFVAGKLSHERMRTWRVVLGATVGALYGVTSLLYSLPTVVEIVVEIAAAFAVVAVALWRGRAARLLLQTALFYGASVLLGGAMTLIYSKLGKYKTYIDVGGSVRTALGDVPLWVFALAAVASAILTKLLSSLMKRKNGAGTCRVELVLDGRKYELTGLVDSGNVCVEPISETPVIFLSSKFHDAARADGLERGVFAVPVATAAGGGVVLAKKPESLKIMTKRGFEARRALVAAGEREDYDGCDALVPLELL